MQTSLSLWLFVCLRVAFLRLICSHDCQCKMWIWMPEKRELVFVKYQALARHKPEGGACQTCVPQSCWNVFSLCLENWVHFQLQKSVPLQLPRPCCFLFLTTNFCCRVSFTFWDVGVMWWWRGSVFFSSLPGTGFRIWFHARKIQSFSCCWFGSRGVGPLFPTGLPKSVVLALFVLHLRSVLNLGFRVKLGRDLRCGDLMALAAVAHPAHDLHLIAVSGNVLAKLGCGLTPVFCQRKLDWTLITTLKLACVVSKSWLWANCHLQLSTQYSSSLWRTGLNKSVDNWGGKGMQYAFSLS